MTVAMEMDVSAGFGLMALPETNVKTKAECISVRLLFSIRLLICAAILHHRFDQLHKHVTELVLPPSVQCLHAQPLVSTKIENNNLVPQ